MACFHHKSRVPVLFLLVIFFASCHSSVNLEMIKQRTREFRSQVDAEQYHDIYADADHGLREAATEADFTALMQAIHRKLGKVQQSHIISRNDSTVLGVGTLVTVIYETKFSGGDGTEQFIWRIHDGRPFLFGYHLNSDAMITK